MCVCVRERERERERERTATQMPARYYLNVGGDHVRENFDG